MRYTIEQTGPNEWQLIASDGTVVGTFTDQDTKGGKTGYDLAMLALAGIIGQTLRADAGDSEDGLLPEGWVSDAGIAFSERLEGGRDFTMTDWMWRDPGVATVPLMFMTRNDIGHFSAELVGFFTEITEDAGTIHSAGRFYDTEIGAQARDTLKDGRSFGISVDPGEATQVEEDFQCDEFDDDGFCVAGTYSLNFLVYEIIGATMTAMQGFPKAAIKLAASVAASASRSRAALADQVAGQLAATAGTPAAEIETPARPAFDRMMLAPPVLGQPFLGGELADEFLVDQGDGSLAIPLTIEEPYVYGHVARWGACHTGDPWGPGVCAGPEPSLSGYAYFHTGHVMCDNGTDVPTGVLTVGPEHAPAQAAPFAAADYYAAAANGWADVHAVDDDFGIFVCGVLRPGLTELDVRVLRALSLSGDWRSIGGNMEMIGALAVNGPGLPIKRELLTASAWKIGTPALRASSINGEPRVLIAAGMVARCPECQRRRAEAASGRPAGTVNDPRIDQILTVVERLDRRTKHLNADAAAHMRAQMRDRVL
jgi:hypothetical protein